MADILLWHQAHGVKLKFFTFVLQVGHIFMPTNWSATEKTMNREHLEGRNNIFDNPLLTIRQQPTLAFNHHLVLEIKQQEWC